MNVLRPAGGFRIKLSEGVERLVQNQIEGSPAFAQYWDDIKERLRFVAHTEGVADNRFGRGHRLWAASADDERGQPRVRLVYMVLGDRVTIKVASFG